MTGQEEIAVPPSIEAYSLFLILNCLRSLTTPEMSQRKDDFVRLDIDHTQILIKSSTLFIESSLEYLRNQSRNGQLDSVKARCYAAEILHSILFIGYMNEPSIEPQQILSQNVVERLTQSIPEPFEKYRSHLPLRTPFSILLDVVVETAGDQVLEKLLALNAKMHIPQNDVNRCRNDFCLASTVISYCYFEDKQANKKSEKYYGGSVACTGKPKRDFFINLSCVETWNRKVALGVCLAAKGRESIFLPKFVHSAAFTLLNDQRDEDPESYLGHVGEGQGLRYIPKPPCEKCWKIFPGVKFSPSECDERRAQWKHGNCAECEAMSKLLNNVSAVNEGVTWGKPPQSLTTEAARTELRPYLNLRIQNLKSTLKNRIDVSRLQFFSQVPR
ncbi:hypothetical protein GJAV_G00221670 [Gymnothorax javanicus]|nr:hypothetical protein GJAV_G00221670 [Gymnothorax javanicus]